MKKKTINVKKESLKENIEDVKIESKPIIRPPDAEIPPDPNKPKVTNS